MIKLFKLCTCITYFFCFIFALSTNSYIKMKNNLLNILVGIWVQVPRLHRMMFVDGDLPFFINPKVNDYVKQKTSFI